VTVGKTIDLVSSSISAPQSHPAIAAGSTSYLVTWADGRSGKDFHLYAGLVDPEGAPVGAPTKITEDPLDASGPLGSTVAFAYGAWLVAWSSGNDVRARVVGLDGKPSGSVVVVSRGAGASGAIALSADGPSWVAAFRDDRTGVPRILAARIDGSGKVLDPDGIVLGDGLRPLVVSASFGSGQAYVAWLDEIGEPAAAYLDTTKLTKTPVAIAKPPLHGIVAAGNNLATLAIERFDDTGALYGAIGDTTFVFPTPMRLLSKIDARAVASPSWDGSKFVFAYGDFASDVRAQRIRTTGVSLDEPSILVRSGFVEHPQVAIASIGNHRSFVVYTEHDVGDPSNARVRGTPLSATGARGERCMTSAECESGFCVDSFCCDRACDGACERCTGGNCLVRTGTPRPGRCPAPTERCRIAWCDGKDANTCTQYVTRGSLCKVPHCADDVLENAGVCTPEGECRDMEPKTVACAPYRCASKGTQCLPSCSKDGDCVEGYTCRDSKCTEADWIRKIEHHVDPGCNCRMVVPREPTSRPALAAFALAGAILARRRRSRRPLSSPR